MRIQYIHLFFKKSDFKAGKAINEKPRMSHTDRAHAREERGLQQGAQVRGNDEERPFRPLLSQKYIQTDSLNLICIVV